MTSRCTDRLCFSFWGRLRVVLPSWTLLAQCSQYQIIAKILQQEYQISCKLFFNWNGNQMNLRVMAHFFIIQLNQQNELFQKQKQQITSYLSLQKNMRHIDKTAITLSILIVTLQTVHIQHQAAYIQSLKNIQQSLISHTTSIKLAYEQNNPQTLTNKSLDQKIRIFQELITTQRISLLTMLKSYHYDLNNTPWTCQPFSPIAKLHLQNSYNNMKLKFKQLKVNLLVHANITAHKSIADFSQKVDIILQTQPSAYSSKGKEESFTRQQNKKITNLNAGMWALGNIAPTTLNQQLNNIQTQPSAEMCPFYIPYADREGRCRQCPRQRPYFILQGQSCFICFTYDRQRRQCLDQKGNILAGTILFTNYHVTKQRILLLQNQTFELFSSNTENLSLCPINTPFFNGKQCIDCPKELYFSPSENICRSCPTDYYYEPKSMTCKKVKYYSRAEFLSWSTQRRRVEEILQEISLKKSQISFRECPQKAPFSINTQCIACQKPGHFSYDSLRCETCPQKTILNLNMHKCVRIGNINYQTNPMTSPKLILNGRSLNQWANMYYSNMDNSSGISDCPNDHPYFDGIACITCPNSHPYFNLEKLICQYCPGTTIYDPAQRQCISNIQKRAVQVPTWQKMAAAVFS